ncbi:prephenate dehydrogenase [Clostridium sp. CM028]|uniref:prephenate dehydrogenase n=1 Tax=unclassified Clostridium TaxID=2614128 RepID=UPI001C0B5B73|nr:MULTISPECIES: prephenate dehydrogenase [unclassified Clostridium]MBU3093344.1 prephenate dehydrogenase [Clostridium sp. CF011]MBW9147245.1 prephenate dehydrogenase [Clostridium sp. CM027]MBW9150452.1 prephenate dehydrogenase [Clostridium sp. CM028]UVE41800.1 prephenate dehydrogenase [Clostridium sp. CM027]WAG70800.1 prephenate dehydrogenase [Clostridium sp. CF011]
MDCTDFNITIVGLGLIGGSFAMALRELKPKNIWAIDIDKDVLDIAEEMNIIDKGYTSPEIPLSNSDIVILAVYPQKTIDFVKNNMNLFKSGAVITDTAGIKSNLISEIMIELRDDLDFIGGHPMAGKEESGLKAATKDMFKNANYILTPINGNKEENINLVTGIVRGMGCKSVVRLTPNQHDDIIAYTSQLPHVIAVSLIDCNSLIVGIPQFVGGSFKDTTRVATINGELWPELLFYNEENIVSKIEDFENNIKEIKDAIINHDEAFLKKRFENATNKRKEISKGV